MCAFQRSRAKKIIAETQARLRARKDALRKSLTENEVLITKERENILSLDIDTLRQQLKNGTLKPIHVLKAYQVHNHIVI